MYDDDDDDDDGNREWPADLMPGGHRQRWPRAACGGGGGSVGVIASSDLVKQLSTLQREQDAMHGKLGAVHGELGAVHGKLDAVLAWIATENEARERGGGGR